MQPEPLDLVSLLIVLLAFIVSKDVAIAVGPYAAVGILACAGAGISLSGNDRQMSLPQACWYVSIRVLMAVSLTIGLAELFDKSTETPGEMVKSPPMRRVRAVAPVSRMVPLPSSRKERLPFTVFSPAE